MRAAIHLETNLSALSRAVGKGTFERGRDYARNNMVVELHFDPDDDALCGTVLGSGQDEYESTVYLVRAADGSLEFEQGQCTCPVGFDCKHCVAVLLTALDNVAPAAEPAAPMWEAALAATLEESAPAHAGAVPLAIQFALTTAPVDRYNPRRPEVRGPRLTARVARPGRNGWINGQLSWSDLDAQHDAHIDHRRVLRELYALYEARAGAGYEYAYGRVKDIDLCSFDSRQLWPLLDEARAVGIELIHAGKGSLPVRPAALAEFRVDVTRSGPSGAVTVAPSLRIAEDPGTHAVAAFIGAPAHGLVYVDPEHAADPTKGRLSLARLDTPIPTMMQRLLTDGTTLPIPPEDEPRFAAGYYPRLARTATVVSSDDSYSPPRISPPTLLLRADFGPDHHLDLLWQWRYAVGDAEHRVPLYPTASDEYRDVAGEREILDGLDVPFEQYGLRADADAPLSGRLTLRGIDTLRVATELLPLLRGRDDVTVEDAGTVADYREAGDSLRIGVSTKATRGERDWFDLGIDVSVDGQAVPLATVITALSHGESHLLLPDGAYLSLDKPELRTLRTLVEEARALQDADPNSLRISRFQAGLWEELAALGVVDKQAAAWKRQVQGLLEVEAVSKTRVPATLQAELRPYQLAGFRWLTFLWTHQLGGVLADDMGLGKTLQSLALICHARAKKPGDPPFLILAPTSVVPNWAAEAARFAPHLKVVAVTDTFAKRGQSIDEVIAADADIVITSHTLFRLDFDDAYSTRPWSALMIDEAQFAKNHQSKLYQCARRLDAPFKLAITGTPMENNLMELWSLLSIAAPGLFPSPTRFKDYYQRPIESGGDTELLAQLRRRIRPLLLRRTKEQVVSDLPAKQEQVLEVDLHPKHRKLYETQLQRERQKILGLIDDMDKNRFTILRSLTLLRQLSLDAALIDDKHAKVPSAKIDALLEQLADVVEGGHRALVFSQFTGFLGRVRSRLDAEGIEYCYLDGKTRRRAEVLDQFKTGSAPVFLISLKSGGFGLNLTEADYCFLLDPWWNPATEAQAVDRTHRIGQTRNVMVYRLISRGTIEDKVMALKAKKSELFSSVLDEGAALSSALSADDIRELFA